MTKMTIEELAAGLRGYRQQMGISRADAQPIFIHTKTGRHYEVQDIVYREDDMAILVIYSPLIDSTIRFARPMDEFLSRFNKHNIWG